MKGIYVLQLIGYRAEVVDRRDYYSYGQDIGERRYSVVEPYRYSFNGKEDVGEQRWWQDYGARMYHRGLGRFMSADPLIVGQKKYAWLSGYQFAGDTPIWAIDLDGEETKITIRSPWYTQEVQKALKAQDELRAMKLTFRALNLKFDNRWARERYGEQVAILGSHDGVGVHVYGTVDDGKDLREVLLYRVEPSRSRGDDKGAGESWFDKMIRWIESFWNGSESVHKQYSEGSGWIFTSEIGQSQESRVPRRLEGIMEETNIDPILEAFSGLMAASAAGPPQNLLESIQKAITAIELAGNLANSVDLGGKSGKWRCPTCGRSFDAKDTAKHNKELGREYGPFTKVQD